MNASQNNAQDALLLQLLRRAAGEADPPTPNSQRIPASVYTDESRFERERDGLFLSLPLVVGHQSQIPEPGDTLVYDWLGLPLITLRDKRGEVGTFMNVCRHRGMRLLQDEGRTSIRSLVCPYHQWTYGLDGELRNVPRAECFESLDTSDYGLVRLPTEVCHGLIWMQPTPDRPMDLDAHLAGLGPDLDRLDLPDFHFWKQSVKTVDCNWKLVQDAFLDGYHVVRLHRKTVGQFFPDALAEFEPQGRHMRSAVARNEIFDAVKQQATRLDPRLHATFSYTVFPNVVLIFHPDYTSIISLFPLSAERTIFVHSMLTPREPASDKERDHFERSFELIDRGVFEAEDIFVSVGTQKGLKSGANDSLLFGALEDAAVCFHRFVDEALAETE